jgi:hypothetical protein
VCALLGFPGHAGVCGGGGEGDIAWRCQAALLVVMAAGCVEGAGRAYLWQSEPKP